MEITKTPTENGLTIYLTGRLDTITSVKLTEDIDEILAAGKTNLLLDLTRLEYISSAGLRVLLVAHKRTLAQGTKLEITGANETIQEIFKITGFSGILNLI